RTDTPALDLDDDGVMDEPVDGCRRRHRALEDPLPLAEDQVSRDDQRAALVPLGHQGEEQLRFVGGLLHVAEVVEDDDVEDIETPEGRRQTEVTARSEQRLHELICRREQHAAPGIDEGVAESAREVALADARETEDEGVAAPIEELSASELLHLQERRAW